MRHRLNPDHITAVIDIINRGPFFKHLSMEVTGLGPGSSRVRAGIGKHHMNPFGSLHGGVYSSLLDTAAYWSAYCDLEEEEGLVTIDMKVDLLAPVLDPEVSAEGMRIKSGKTLFLTEARMLSSKGGVLAHCTSKLMRIRNKQTMNDVVDYLSGEQLPHKFLRRSYAL